MAYLLGCYQDFGKADPEILTRVIHEVFLEYPEDDVIQAAKQLPRESKWLPSIAEISEALDRLEYDRQCTAAREIMQRRLDEVAAARSEPRRFIDHWVPRVMEFAEGDPNIPKVKTRNWVLIPRPK